MRTDFSIHLWRKWYDKVHFLGKRLQDGSVSCDGVRPENPLTKSEKDDLRDSISFILKRSDDYVYKCFRK